MFLPQTFDSSRTKQIFQEKKKYPKREREKEKRLYTQKNDIETQSNKQIENVVYVRFIFILLICRLLLFFFLRSVQCVLSFIFVAQISFAGVVCCNFLFLSIGRLTVCVVVVPLYHYCSQFCDAMKIQTHIDSVDVGVFFLWILRWRARSLIFSVGRFDSFAHQFFGLFGMFLRMHVNVCVCVCV